MPSRPASTASNPRPAAAAPVAAVQTPQQPDKATTQHVAEVLAGAYVTGQAAGSASGLAALLALLVPWGFRIDVVKVAYKISMTRGTGTETRRMGPAELAAVRQAATYRAWFIQNSAARMQARMAQGESLADAARAEAAYLTAHQRAQARRRHAARQVDAAAAKYGRVLQWSARMDTRTTAECRAADGHVFKADAGTLIGWPGAVHPFCRCRAVMPTVAGMRAGWVNDAVRPLLEPSQQVPA